MSASSAEATSNIPTGSGAASLVETTSTDVSWFDTDPGARLTPEVRSFYNSYCGIPEDQLLSHLEEARLRAWNTLPYPCIGQWGFLSPQIEHSPAFATMLARVKDGATMLDIGCFMGQTLRWLAAAGAPSDRMYGTDVEGRFWEIGYDLFRDRDRFKGEFLRADILDQNDTALAKLGRKVDVVWIANVLHLFSWDEQINALKSIIRLSRAGALVAAMQIGRTSGTEVETGWKTGKKKWFHHDADSVKKLWAEAGRDTQTKWEVTARTAKLAEIMPEKRDWEWLAPENRGLLFEARRVE